MIRETRAVTIDQAEVRKTDDGALNFTGHAAVFNERTWIGPKRWGFWEEVDPGFFDDVLEDRTAFLVNHDPNLVLARNGSTMKLTVDDRGLVPDAQWDSADADAVKWAGRVKRGDVNEMSFAFTVKEEKWAETESGEEVRTLLKAEQLYDVSLVTYPAYEGTDGSMRDSAAEVVKRHRGYDPRVSRGGLTTGEYVVPATAVTTGTTGALTTVTLTTPKRAKVENPTVPAHPALDLLTMRHRLNAARFGFPLAKRDIIPAGDITDLVDDANEEEGEDDEDEDIATDNGFLTELIEEHQELVSLATEYLSESEPETRDARVVTLAQAVVAAAGDQVTKITNLLASL